MLNTDAAIAQSVVRNIGSVEVTGSIPVSSLTRMSYIYGIFFLSIYFNFHINHLYTKVNYSFLIKIFYN